MALIVELLKVVSQPLRAIGPLHHLIRNTSTPSLFLALVVGGSLALLLWARVQQKIARQDPTLPPVVSYWVPFLGSIVSYGMNPIKFMQENRKKHGDVFTFIMLGRRVTFCLGVGGNHFVLNSKTSDVSAEEAYTHLTTPVFGEEVVYDVPNHVLMEQKRFVKTGLTPELLKGYVSVAEQETRQYLTRWSNGPADTDIFQDMSKLIINTASRCLLGKEVRARMDDTVAGLYHDLDRGFTPLNFLFPSLPLPSYRRRDAAHQEMRKLFMSIIQNRRDTQDMDNKDMLQTLMGCSYKDGRKLTDKEIVGIMIACLMAGQHTSSTTSAWALLFLSANPEIQEQVYQEVISVAGREEPLTYDAISSMKLLDSTIRETLRLRPPIHTILRKVIKPISPPGTSYIIPPGHYVASSPNITQLDETIYEESVAFKPERWLGIKEEDNNEPGVDYGWGVLANSSARSPYLPFGAGRHRCIGESFAYVQLKTIIAQILRTYRLNVVDPERYNECNFNSMIVMPLHPSVRYTRRS